jgi:hypothetical protein
VWSIKIVLLLTTLVLNFPDVLCSNRQLLDDFNYALKHRDYVPQKLAQSDLELHDVSFSIRPIYTQDYKQLSCSVNFVFVSTFWRGIVTNPSALTTDVFDNNIQYLLYISGAVAIINCDSFIIIMTENVKCTELYFCSVWE